MHGGSEHGRQSLGHVRLASEKLACYDKKLGAEQAVISPCPHKQVSNGSNSQVVEIAQKVFELLTQGSFTNTYKYATLLGILDALEERSTADGPPSMITSRELAEHVLRIYWPQCSEFRPNSSSGSAHLAQQSGATPTIISAIRKWREQWPSQTIAEYRQEYRRAESDFRDTHQTRPARALINEVETVLIMYPIPLLQKVTPRRIGRDASDERTSQNPFLYEWSNKSEPPGLKAYLDGALSPIDNRLKFFPGVPECLLTLASLLRPMIQTEWTRFVSRIKRNEIASDKVFAFLFERERRDLEAVRSPLRELQENRCFYCGEILQKEKGHVDHFVPWSRHPNDAIENLTLAHASCNVNKSNFLAAPEHLEKWKERLRTNDLSTIADTLRWPTERHTSVSIIQALYGQLAAGVMLWSTRDRMVPWQPSGSLPLLRAIDKLRDAA